nr:hypothetical protein B0A51_04640 [Rachicladosporium sp. CCFEE 5018]
MAAVAPGGMPPPPPPPPPSKRRPTSKAAPRPSKKQITCPGCDEDRSLEEFREVFGADGDDEMADGEDALEEGALGDGNDSADPNSKKCDGKCQKVLPLDSFAYHSSGIRRGARRDTCKKCRRSASESAARKAAKEDMAKPLSAEQERKKCMGECQQMLSLVSIPFFPSSGRSKSDSLRQGVCKKCKGKKQVGNASALDLTAQQADNLSAVRQTSRPLTPALDLSGQQENNSSTLATDAVTQPGSQDNQRSAKKRRMGFGLKCVGCQGILGDFYTKHPNGNDLVCPVCLKKLRCAEEYASLRSAPLDPGWEDQNFLLPTSGIARGAVMHQNLASAEASFASEDARVRYRHGLNYWHLSMDDLINLSKERQFSAAGNRKDINLQRLQLADAQQGLLPVPRPLPSRYHAMQPPALRSNARQKKYSRVELALEDDDNPDLNTTELRESMIAHCLRYDAQENISYWATMDEMSRQALIDILVDDLTTTLGLREQGIKAHKLRNRTLFGEQTSYLRRVQVGGITGITGTDSALEALDALVRNHRVSPNPTSSLGWLCGVRALSDSLHDARWRDARLNNRAPPSQITYEDMMRLLFQNWDADEQYEPGQQGTPTPEYETFIRRAYHDSVGAENFPLLRYEMLAMNNLDADQLQAVLTLLHQNGTLDYHYQLGVIASAHVREASGERLAQEVAPWVRFVNDFMSNENAVGSNLRPVLFVHNNIAFGGGIYNHFEGMVESGDIDSIYGWGMYIGGAEEIEAARFVDAKSMGLRAEETAEEKAKRMHINELHMASKVARKSRTACTPCRKRDQKCTGDAKAGPPCPECTEVGTEDDCEWSNVTINPGFIEGVPTEESLRRFDNPLRPENFVANQWAVDPPTDEENFISIFVNRASSHPGAAGINTIAFDQQQTMVRYNNMLNGGLANPIGNHPEGTRPLGVGSVMRKARFVFARHGARAVPTAVGNVQNPAVLRIVGLIDELFGKLAPNQNPPDEIQFVLGGLAGYSVGVMHWGSRTGGFFHYVSLLDPRLADRIFIVVLAEPPVVDGIAASSLQGITNVTVPGWQFHGHKLLHKAKLADLVDRYEHRQATALALAYNLAPPPPLPHIPLQALPNLNMLIDAMGDEEDWRSGRLDVMTVPTNVIVDQRNINRNAPMN